jgi:hypothetical protein
MVSRPAGAGPETWREKEEMSLPAGQQRVLDGMERALQASEPHMASMFAIFARLNEGSEPVGAEPLNRRRRRGLQRRGLQRRGLQQGRGVYAAALIPVVFIMVVAGVLLGGSAHGLTTCGSGSAVFGGSPWISKSSCRTSGRAAPGSATSGGAKGSKGAKGAKGANGANVTKAAKGARDTTGPRGPKGAQALSGSGLAGASCAAIALTVRAAARTGAQPFVLSASGIAGTQQSPAMCYK